jgi:hypothetical protein
MKDETSYHVNSLEASAISLFHQEVPQGGLDHAESYKRPVLCSFSCNTVNLIFRCYLKEGLDINIVAAELG